MSPSTRLSPLGRNDPESPNVTMSQDVLTRAVLDIPGFEPLLNQLPRGEVANSPHQGGMPDVIIKGSFNISIQDPWPRHMRPSQVEEFLDRVVTSPARAEPVADSLELCFPERFQRVFHHSLDASIHD